MSGINIVLDTNLVLHLLNGDATLGEYLENKNVYVSFITELEVLGYKGQLIEDDPDDNKFVNCAIGANADYLINDDWHIRKLLNRQQPFSPIHIVSFAEFRGILEGK